ncbi:ThiF family adenylyltransferase [Streptomyces sp. TRM66268-LWL]|uniref:ThiF family adenylyltransferase n=1 Tax=Streptomyces polyasparticus TaxID=2767826 RepID=A0ABR7S6R9_9ACTN|nr:ThiF family adenylyltransferase [Streptomyces polyasparticus]MBC9711171.1 ThiF family adenylyltransferase [Streptomyces polyasparticus]
MHPRLKTSLRHAWRDLTTLQLGVTPAHARTLGPVALGMLGLLRMLDGTRGVPLLRAEARAAGLPEGQVDALLDRLTAAGLLDDATAGAGDPAVDRLRARPEAADRLAPEAAALSLVDGAPGAGIRRLAWRGRKSVQVRGAGRVGAQVAALLSAAGVGRVDVVDSGRVEPWDVTPGGLPGTAVGERRADAARRLVRRCASGCATRPRRGYGLVVLTPRDGLAAYAPDPAEAEHLVARGVPHLYAGVLEATGFAGPLVLPGHSPCAGCAERQRIAEDPAWPLLLTQWRSGGAVRTGRGAPVPAGALALSAAVAGLAAAQALAHLDGDIPAATGHRWELTLPRLAWQSIPLRPHPACPCGAQTSWAQARQASVQPNPDTASEDPTPQETMSVQTRRVTGRGGHQPPVKARQSGPRTGSPVSGAGGAHV